VHNPSVGDGERTGEALSGEIVDKAGKDWGNILPGKWTLAARSDPAEWTEAEADRHILRRDAAGFDQSRDQPSSILRWRAEIEIDGYAGLEIDAVERGADRGSGRRKAKAVVADGRGENERDAVRTVVQVFENLGVGGLRIGQIDPLTDGPRRTRSASCDGLRFLSTRLERLGGDTVIGRGAQRGEGRALERLLNERPPRRLVAGREVADQGEFHHCRQALSSTCPLLA